MARWIPLISLLCQFATNCLAQNPELDSLIALLNAETKRDTTRVNRLIEVHGHLILNDASSTLPYVEEAMQISREIHFAKGIGFSENAMGMYYLYSNENKEKALEHVLRSVQILDSIGDENHIITSYNNLGLIYQRLKRHKDSQAIYTELYNRLKPHGVNNNLLAVCNNLGLAYQNSGDHVNAIEWYRRLLSLSEEAGSKFGVLMANGNLGRVYENLEDYPKMLEHSQVTLDMANSMGLAKQMATGHQAVGKANGKMGNYDLAIHHTLISDSIGTAINDLSVSANSREFLAEYYERTDNLKQALRYMRLAKEANDSISINESRRNIEEMRVRFNTEETEKEKELAQLEAEKLSLENRQSRNQTMGITVIALLILLLGGVQMNRMRANKKAELIQLKLKQNEEEAQWKEQLRQSRMSALKSQMNPHFIFNALNSVQSLFYKDEKEKASKYLGRFSKLMRSVLEMSDRPTVSLEDELEALASYLELEKLRFEDAFSYSINLNDDVEDDMIMVPSMLIQPYVENALKHGLAHKEGVSELRIDVKLEEKDSLMVTVCDNGIGRDAANEIRIKNDPHHRSFATEATAQRLDLLNNNRSNKLVVSIEDLKSAQGKPIGTKVSILIPLST